MKHAGVHTHEWYQRFDQFEPQSPGTFLERRDDPFECIRCGYRVGVDELHDMTMGHHAPWRHIVQCTANWADYHVTALHTDAADPEDVLGTEWFHATDVKDWLTRVQYGNVVTHLGSRHTALSRRNYGQIHRLQLDPTARVHPVVFRDYFDTCDNLDCFREAFGDYTVIRYVNWWETPGEISLLVDPAVLRCLSTESL